VEAQPAKQLVEIVLNVVMTVIVIAGTLWNVFVIAMIVETMIMVTVIT
jgi:hypothetical protein